MVADGQLVVPGGDGAVLFEPGDRPLDDVALPVAHEIHPGRPAAPRSAAGSSLLLVGPLGDGVGDPAPAQHPPAGGVAVAAVGHQVLGPFAGPTRAARARHPDGVQQRFQLCALMLLAGGDQHPQRSAAAVAGQVDLGGQPAAAVSQCLLGLGSRP